MYFCVNRNIVFNFDLSKTYLSIWSILVSFCTLNKIDKIDEDAPIVNDNDPKQKGNWTRLIRLLYEQ